MQIKGAALSDTGKKRSVNEDSWGYFEQEKLFIVSDGMGGHVGGKKASEIAVAGVRDYCASHITDDEDVTLAVNSTALLSPGARKLKAAIQFANQQIVETANHDPAYHGMGATIVALLIDDNRANICHVGDSRVYLIRSGVIRQMTADHSLVAEMLRRKELTEEEAKIFPHKNVITRALGRKDTVSDAVVEKCQNYDFFILCSDGLTNMVADEEIKQLVLAHKDELPAACKALIDLANQRGGVDNITVIVINVFSEN